MWKLERKPHAQNETKLEKRKGRTDGLGIGLLASGLSGRTTEYYRTVLLRSEYYYLVHRTAVDFRAARSYRPNQPRLLEYSVQEVKFKQRNPVTR